jgi:hypothetical protein
MPKKKQNTYEIEGLKFKSFASAAAKAVDMSLERGDPVTIVEHGQTGTYFISVQANSEQAD